ncbi:MAG TPA: hypothetical protein DCM45_00055 [Clostridiales bacterium]|nr:hypothetical protein [Clostridiales bacterium]
MYTNSPKQKHHKNAPPDLFGQVQQEALRQGGLSVFAYYSVGWDEHMARLHPEWTGRNSSGEINHPRNVMARWNTLCINSPYRNVVLDQIEELVRSYDFPALFLDIIMYNFGDFNTPCYCSYCQQRWLEGHAEPMPRVFNLSDKARYLKFRNEFYRTFLTEIRERVRQTGKKVQLVHNFGVDFDFDDYMSKEAEPWGYDYYSNSVAAKVFRSYGNGKPVEIISARFNQSWDFTVKPPVQLVWEAMTALAHNSAFMVIDQPNIDGSIEPQSTSLIRQVFSEVKKVEALVADTRPYSEIALLYSYKNQELIYNKLHCAQFEEEFLGAYKMLTELHVPFDVIADERLSAEQLRNIKVLIVPNILGILPDQARLIRAFADNGGHLVFTYKSNFIDENGLPLGKNDRSFGLLKSASDSEDDFRFAAAWGDMPTPYVRINQGSLDVHPASGMNSQTLSNLVNVAFANSPSQWNSHNVQPGDPDEHPALLTMQTGLGHATYFPYKFFSEYLAQGLAAYKQGFKEILFQGYQPVISVQTHANVEANYLQSGHNIRLFLTNCCVTRPAGNYRSAPCNFPTNYDEVLPVGNLVIQSRKEMLKCSSLKYPDLAIKQTSGVWEAVLPALEIYDIVLCEFAE